ncbi:hypothetical protein MNEG_15053 [Monoraphidium neglectum]|uniref:Uncharacterized protein n=1 Tax=Monoraphidium neglectum TaxID=145388 RepID=A0A0D2LT37_9CHLO|nr:hypothetical protein MNEG_15053 [Monoraphidium neglectum]KIY92911.1 hypothetical protein MNEG_15053 [Monoraphidium neglectum]|eukprot:XP_013891931.1 hypothetical protein MNEG_15053 [Monoraphidium neglectum]
MEGDGGARTPQGPRLAKRAAVASEAGAEAAARAGVRGLRKVVAAPPAQKGDGMRPRDQAVWRDPAVPAAKRRRTAPEVAAGSAGGGGAAAPAWAGRGPLHGRARGQQRVAAPHWRRPASESEEQRDQEQQQQRAAKRQGYDSKQQLRGAQPHPKRQPLRALQPKSCQDGRGGGLAPAGARQAACAGGAAQLRPKGAPQGLAAGGAGLERVAKDDGRPQRSNVLQRRRRRQHCQEMAEQRIEEWEDQDALSDESEADEDSDYAASSGGSDAASDTQVLGCSPFSAEEEADEDAEEEGAWMEGPGGSSISTGSSRDSGSEPEGDERGAGARRRPPRKRRASPAPRPRRRAAGRDACRVRADQHIRGARHPRVRETPLSAAEVAAAAAAALGGARSRQQEPPHAPLLRLRHGPLAPEPAPAAARTSPRPGQTPAIAAVVAAAAAAAAAVVRRAVCSVSGGAAAAATRQERRAAAVGAQHGAEAASRVPAKHTAAGRRAPAR